MKCANVIPASLGIAAIVLSASGGCATTPKAKDQPMFLSDARATTTWLESNVKGLHEQIASSAGYTVFPDVLRYGAGFGGGEFGHGMVAGPDGRQVGWSAVNVGSCGLQAGVQGFKMLIVFQDKAALEKFKANQLSGSAAGVVVAGDSVVNSTARFENGVAVYQGANVGLMAGVNVGLELIRFEPI